MLSINNNSMLNIKNNRLFIEINTFLICLLPLALITGPAIPDFIVILVSIFFLFYFINKGFKIITDKKFFIFFIFFFFFLFFFNIFIFVFRLYLDFIKIFYALYKVYFSKFLYWIFNSK